MEEQDLISDQIKDLILDAEHIKGDEFRLTLEDLVNRGDEQAEFTLVQYLNDPTITHEIRMDIIRVIGYLRRDSFLLPLKKIIDTTQHARVQQEAVIAVAKYNDRRALNILNQSLQRINNPFLISTINTEISKIKENNPILALLPRFQEGQRNPKTFNITLQILKRILLPADATIFTKFLNSDDPMIQNGAFEILCIAGDIFHDDDILNFYQDHFDLCPCLKAKECEELYLMTYHIKIYLSRYHFLIEEQVPNMMQKFYKVTDIRVKQLLLSLICKSKKTRTIDFLKEVYELDPQVKPYIIEELSGNELATSFLFEKYRTDPELKTRLIQSLLTTKEGLEYFIQHFFNLPFDHQECITQNLPYAGNYNLVDFIKQIFQSNLYHLKEILLSKVKEMYEFSVEEILFDPTHEREFFFMGNQYFDTLNQLFPVSASKMLLTKIKNQYITVNNIRKFLVKIDEVASMELIFTFKDKDFITELLNKIVKMNNTVLNADFLSILKYIKTLDVDTFQSIRDSVSMFVALRETSITPAEKRELGQIKRSLNDLFRDYKRIVEGRNQLEHFYRGDLIDFKTFAQVLKTCSPVIAIARKELFSYILQQLDKSTPTNAAEWHEFFSEFPRITCILKSQIQEKVDKPEIAYKAIRELIENLSGNPIRFALNFKNKKLTAVLREEFKELNLEIEVLINEMSLTDMDILLCDTETFREMIFQGKNLPDKIYLFIEDMEGFSEVKTYQTRNFIKPFFYYRILREIVQDIYL